MSETIKRITVRASAGYEVVIGRGALPAALPEFASAHGGRFAVISDTNVAPLHAKRVVGALGGEVPVFAFDAGEASKNVVTLTAILEFLAQNELSRTDAVIALGGGVVGDVTALAAALYMRGIDYVQLPTSLVAAVDSSVGGKCAVDLAAGKNLAGVFKQPALVICDPDLIDTLPEEELSCGMAEVIKYGLGFDAALFERCAAGGRENAYSLIAECVDIKRRVVEEDEFDRGERMKLNLGHTAGHAIEKLSDFSIPHGRAVGIGLYIMTRAFLPHAADAVCSVLRTNGLSTVCPFNAYELSRAALSDKKRTGSTISLVVPTGIGECEVRSVGVGELEAIFAGGLS